MYFSQTRNMQNWILELWHFRELLVALTLREIKVRYKQTLLGAAWAILQPASLTVIFTIVFGVFLKVDSGPVPYPVFAYCALLPWTLFTTAVSFGSLSVVNNGNLVTKIYFPREILPLSSVGAALFDFIMATIVFVVLIFFYHIQIGLNILYFPVFVLLILLFTIGISFILSTLNVLFRDIKFVVPLLLQIWLYLTPVIYSSNQVPEKYRSFLKLNPLVPLVEGFRDVTIFNKGPNLLEITVYFLITLLIFTFGYWWFKSKEKIFADIM